jgi:S-adenosylmethionine:diacylglycerol 3-amino-3-carboxypropyl transferase
VEAYFIKMESSILEGKLYEIVLKNYEYAVLHSKSIWLLDVLKKEGVFLEKKQKSVIDYYVNQRY